MLSGLNASSTTSPCIPYFCIDAYVSATDLSIFASYLAPSVFLDEVIVVFSPPPLLNIALEITPPTTALSCSGDYAFLPSLILLIFCLALLILLKILPTIPDNLPS